MNHTIKVDPKNLSKALNVQSSRISTLQFLTISLLYPGAVIIQNFNRSRPMRDYINELIKIGIEITFNEDSLIIYNSFPQCEKEQKDEDITLKPPYGKEFIYLFFSLLSKGKKKYHVIIDHPKARSYIETIKNSLNVHKLHMEIPDNISSPIAIQGPCIFRHSLVEFSEKVDPKFVSAMSLTYCDGPLQFQAENIRTHPYYTQTLNSIKIFYFEKVRKNFQFYIPINFHLAQLYMASSMIQGSVLIKNCQMIDMMQKETSFLQMLVKIGGQYKITLNGLYIIRPTEFKDLTLPYEEVKDIFPLLVYISANSDFSLTLTNFKVSCDSNKNIDITDHFLGLLKELEVPFKYDVKTKEFAITEKAPRIVKKNLTLFNHYYSIIMTYLFLQLNKGGEITEQPSKTKSRSFRKALRVIKEMESNEN